MNNTDIERTVGGKVVGIAAAILVLSGLILLGAAFIPQLPASVKAALIFVFALGLTVAGTILTSKSRTVFSYALFISGLLACFVAIFVSQAYFGIISHAAALTLSGIWMAVSVGLVAYTRTWPLTIALCAVAGIIGIQFLEGNLGAGAYNPAFEVVFLTAYVLVVMYCAALSITGIKLAEDTPAAAATDTHSTNARTSKKALANIFVLEGALFFATINSSWHYSEGALMVLLAAILLDFKLAPLPAPLATSHTALRVNEIVLLFFAAWGFLVLGIAGGQPELPTVLSYGVFAIAALLLAGLRALDRTKAHYVPEPSVVVVFFAAGITGVVVNYICNVALVDPSPYLWSALCMLCALVALAAGFLFGEKPLRLFGLIVALLCILKIAMFDLSGNTLAHALALVIAGIICFAISALYTYANKRLV